MLIFFFLLIALISALSTKVVILYSKTSENYYGKSTYFLMVNGAKIALKEAEVAFSILNVSEQEIPEDVEVAIDPSNAALSELERERIEAFLMRGGKVIAAYESGLKYPDGKLRDNYIYGDFLKIKFLGWRSGPYRYMKVTKFSKEELRFPEDFVRMPRGFTFIFKTEDATPLAYWCRDASGTPSQKENNVAAVLSESGVYFGENIFLFFEDYPVIREFFIKVLFYLLNKPPAEVNLRELYLKKVEEALRKLEKAFSEAGKDCEEFMDYAEKKMNDSDEKGLRKLLDEIWEEMERLSDSKRIEARGIWLDHNALEQIKGEEDLRKMIRMLKKAGFNMIFPEVVFRGYTLARKLDYYPIYSAFETLSIDPLEVIVEEARNLGMEVHAWFWVYAVGSKGHPSPIMERHPDWIEKSKTGVIYSKSGLVWLSHARKDVEEFLLKSIRDLLENYDLDGVNLDYVRYGDDSMGYDDAAISAFKSEEGIDPREIEKFSREELKWQLWREKRVSDFVCKASKVVRRRGKLLSVDVYPTLSGARLEKKQNWEEWIYRKWVDFIIPMDYRSTVEDLKILLQKQSAMKDKVFIYPGLQMMKVRSWRDVLSQMKVVRDLISYGSVLFSLSYIDSLNVDALRAGMFRFNAIPPHADFESLKKAMNEGIVSILSSFSEKALPGDVKKAIAEKWSKVLNASNEEELFNGMVEIYFSISDSVKDPAIARKLLDTFSYFMDVLRPRMYEGENYVPGKPEGMVIIDNPVPVPIATIAEMDIKVDGKIEDWKSAQWLSEFRLNDTGEPCTPITRVKVAWKGNWLYVLFEAHEYDWEGVKVVSGRRDTRTYLGDSVEVFVLKDEENREYYHFVVGIDGTLYDEKGFDSMWNGNVLRRVWKEEEKWYVEMGIDVSSFGMRLHKGMSIKVNFTRNRWRAGKAQYSSWSVTYGSYHTPERFGTLKLGGPLK